MSEISPALAQRRVGFFLLLERLGQLRSVGLGLAPAFALGLRLFTLGLFNLADSVVDLVDRLPISNIGDAHRKRGDSGRYEVAEVEQLIDQSCQPGTYYLSHGA